MDSFYTNEELKIFGFKEIGENVFISRKASIYSPNKISIGNNVRIDDFCILSGNIKIGNYVHISAFCALYGKYGIEISDYCGCSPRCILFSASDDFSGEYMVSPMVDDKYTKVSGGPIKMEKYSQLGANSIVMPNITISEGAATGTFTFINKNLDLWKIYIGIPVKYYSDRKQNIKELSYKFENEKKTHK